MSKNQKAHSAVDMTEFLAPLTPQDRLVITPATNGGYSVKVYDRLRHPAQELDIVAAFSNAADLIDWLKKYLIEKMASAGSHKQERA